MLNASLGKVGDFEINFAERPVDLYCIGRPENEKEQDLLSNRLPECES
jgi:hypothetical protein